MRYNDDGTRHEAMRHVARRGKATVTFERGLHTFDVV